MAAHNTYVMAQAMVFQAVTAPGLILCGALLYGSKVFIATGMCDLNIVSNAKGSTVAEHELAHMMAEATRST